MFEFLTNVAICVRKFYECNTHKSTLTFSQNTCKTKKGKNVKVEGTKLRPKPKSLTKCIKLISAENTNENQKILSRCFALHVLF